MLVQMATPSERRAIVRGSCEKSVDCEACGGQFDYVLTRDAAGADNSLFSWTETASMQKAQANASRNLERLLAREHDAVLCPHCGWLQQAMVAAVRRQSYVGLREVAKISFLFAGAAAAVFAAVLIALLAGFGPGIANAGPLLLGVGAVPLIALPGILAWVVRLMLNQAYSPNAGHHVRAEPGSEVHDGLAEQ